MIWLGLVILLTCILFGSRLGGMAMGTMSGVGLLIFVFVLGFPPSGPPGAVLGMIIAVITALASMEAAGGMQYLVSVAEKVLRRNPKAITFIAPVVSYLMIFLAGTQHSLYALLPVISEVSAKSGIRPERPLTISVIASMVAVVASPISAATVALAAQVMGSNVSLGQILMVVVPATFIGTLIGALSVFKRGKELSEMPAPAPVKQEDGKPAPAAPVELVGKALSQAKGATFLFFGAVLFVVALGLFPGLKPHYTEMVNGEAIDREIDQAKSVMIVMLAAAAFIMLFFKASPAKAAAGPSMRSGIVAIISILGISWMGASFFEGNEAPIIDAFKGFIEGREWLFALCLFFLSVLLDSQAATIVTLFPVGLSLGIPAPMLVALAPATCGPFFLPTYGTMLAATNFDRTSSTTLGTWLLNHSFMRPGLVTVASSTAIGLLLAKLIL